MEQGRPWVLAALCGFTGLFWFQIWGVAAWSSDVPAVTISLSALAVSGTLLWISAAIALLMSSPFAVSLGLRGFRVSGGILLGWVVGMLGLSQALEFGIELAGFGGVGTLAELELGLRGLRGGLLALAVFCIGIGPGIAEELAFRGLLQGVLVRRLGPFAGIVLAALAFGAVHLDPVHAPAAFFLGLYLGAVRWLSGSVLPAIICHVANNTFATLGTASGLDAAYLGLAVIVVGAVAGVFAFRAAWSQRSRNLDAEVSRERLQSPEKPADTREDLP